ncbi:MAG: RluA family pseudouridine synthase [Polyangiaceae bacterium]
MVDKPAGLLTAPTPESDRGNLARLVAEKVGGTIYVVHRLDLGTSGLLVMARTEEANRALSEVFRAHDVERAYMAGLKGVVAWDERTVNEPVAGRHAETRFSVVERFEAGATLARCVLTTGRTHQIRLHAKHLGHPVMGDTQHGEASEIDPPRMALHAAVLGIKHPRTGEMLRFESPLPDALSEWVAGLRESGSR